MLHYLGDDELGCVSGGGHAYGKVGKLAISIGNGNTDSFNTGGVTIKGHVTITVGSDSTVQIGSNGGLTLVA